MPRGSRQVLEQSLSSNMPTSVHQLAVTLGYANDGYTFTGSVQNFVGRSARRSRLPSETRSDYVRSLLENTLDERPAPTLKAPQPDASVIRIRQSCGRISQTLCDQYSWRSTELTRWSIERLWKE